ncbi:hypothetical protein SAMN03159376_02463 [Pseudomonas sp. NFACC09-4]|uniref:hypothetical protein n=1 Tax=Pseudomonas sp. NFACC09-4 TaxID=1566237 RepID=UPI0009086AE1|nr:hypothetical protein [Pseudomonas sp. NFACC09-4]SFW61365.1 hypothetical protein SAMN03159376_02463 [Pseudomonas sp. NFACC09-4]
MITINRNKAEEAVRERLRQEREPRMLALDVAYMRALELGEDTAAIVANKQALRGVTEKDLSNLQLVDLAELDLAAALSLP